MALTALSVNLQLCTTHFTDLRGNCALSPLPIHFSEPLEYSHVHILLVPSGTIGNTTAFVEKVFSSSERRKSPPWKKFPTISRMYKRKKWKGEEVERKI